LLLQRRGKPASAIRQSRTTPRAVSGRDQRQPASGVAQDAGGVRRAAAARDDPQPVRGGPDGAGRRAGYDPSQARRNAIAARAAIRQPLVGARTVAATGTRLVVETHTAAP